MVGIYKYSRASANSKFAVQTNNNQPGEGIGNERSLQSSVLMMNNDLKWDPHLLHTGCYGIHQLGLTHPSKVLMVQHGGPYCYDW